MNHLEQTDSYQPTLADAAVARVVPAEGPAQIGRYRVKGVLGRGAFGVVYLADDEQLQRPVAIKVPHRALVPRPEDAEPYLLEARIVASLDHPHIVPVYDAGSTEECPCFVVSKYIEGCTLASRMHEERLSITEAMDLLADLAEALDHAHRRGLVHRDIKPGNILLDTNRKAYIADFGLALKEKDVGLGPKHVGTPTYMSPEQARGEGHRVDGRSDIFSLGVVFYELLAGQRPFRAATKAELLEQIATLEPRPLRQIDEAIPKELERVCLKALAKRAVERYATALDMAEDLRHFFVQDTVVLQSAQAAKETDFHSPLPRALAGSTSLEFSPSGAGSTKAQSLKSEEQRIRIVPKGLRSFDAHDADFFLELLPGPRDREGLPDSIRFWKRRIEETDADNTFSVGLIYGPSGCGKSSLVKAGLLPRLSAEVIAIYIEATARDTETRLGHGLRKRFPGLSADLNLKDTLAALRLGQGLPEGQKVLIVLDQFEQWLHAKREEQNTELVQALRQCDGGKVQCIVMVRDDFWMAVIRFLAELEIELVQGRNFAAADLFDQRHARKVLTAFGQAFGTLPEVSNELTKEQKEFLNQTVGSLAQEGKIICVRLALFAEMMKGKPWTPASLKEVGGTEGVGVTFLEETFSSHAASPSHRLHQTAARAVLKLLLPESGTNIKGHMRSDAELLDASGYAGRPKDFDDLIHILDGELRLITPTDPEGVASDERPGATGDKTPDGGRASRSSLLAPRYYQLTHDYLVPSLRDWLSRKQKETSRGRAELLLEDRATVWNARPENRQLPSFLQWARIRSLTRKKNWSDPQRKMMRKATRFHAVRGLFLTGALVAAALLGLSIRNQIVEENRATHAEELVQRLLDADIAKVPGIIKEIDDCRARATPLLQDANEKASADSRQKLHTSLALVATDSNQVEYLYRRFFDAEPHALSVIRDALFPYKQELRDRLWSVAKRPGKDQDHQRLSAACALGQYDAKSAEWMTIRDQVANDLVEVPTVYLKTWMDLLEDVREELLRPLAAVYRDGKRRETERSLATDILCDWAADRPLFLAELVLDADEKEFLAVFPRLKDTDAALALWDAELTKQAPNDATENARETLAKRRANAAVALLRMDRAEKVWPLLKHGHDPRLRSYLVHRFNSLGADVTAVIKRLQIEPDITIRRALVLSLSEFAETEFSSGERNLLLDKFRALYRDDPDAGLHGAVAWLLRQWKQDQWLKETEKEWAGDREGRKRRLARIKQELAQAGPDAKPRWYINRQGQTLVVIPGPADFMMGSPPTEIGRLPHEQLQHKVINRSFALSATHVTVEQFLRFNGKFEYRKQFAPSEACPVNRVTWYQAAAYCNWLSDQEGLPKSEWCYEPNKDGKYEEGMRMKPNYLSLTGYRLPTEAEWEYACRAGAVTSRHYGPSDELLGEYAWYLGNSNLVSRPVAGLKPNDWGLFDMLGNVLSWCQDCGPRAADDKGQDLMVLDKEVRLVRGSTFADIPLDTRAANRYMTVPSGVVNYIGIRVARTFHDAEDSH